MIVTQSPQKSLSRRGRLAALALFATVALVPVLGQAQPAKPADDVAPAEPKLVGNVFGSNDVNFLVKREPVPLPPSNVIADPTFVAPEKRDFSLPPDSLARKLGADATDAAARASPFPIQPGQLAIIPDGETRDYAKWTRPPVEARPAAAAETAPTTTAAATTTESPSATTAATAKQRERQRAFARSRVRQDNRRFAKDDVAQAEELYQVANKNWRSDAARASVKTMIEKYPELNRTGCAVLYLGQWSTGDEREQLLKRAVEEHSDCFYGNGVQVGGFARYLLGHHYREQGRTAEAEKLFEEIRTNYPDAITHGGQLLAAVLREEGTTGTQSVPATQSAE